MSDAMRNKARLALSGGRDIDNIVLYPDSSALWDNQLEEKMAAFSSERYKDNDWIQSFDSLVLIMLKA